MPPTLCFVGYHNAGKTTIIRKIANILREKGHKIAIIKSTHHKLNNPNSKKDTELYISDGINCVGIISSDRSEIIFNKPVIPEHLIEKFMTDFDLIICEGFKNSDFPKIEVARRKISRKTLFEEGQIDNVVAVISDFKIDGIKNFGFENAAEIAEFIENRFIKEQVGELVKLLVNGKQIEMKKFVSDTLKGIILGYIKNLKGIANNPSTIEIKIHIL